MMIGEGESWGIFGWIWVCTDVRDVGTKGSVEEMSPGPIFVIRPLPWQVRLHGRSKNLNKKTKSSGFKGRQHGVFFGPGSPLRCVVCALCVSLPFVLCFIFRSTACAFEHGFSTSTTAYLTAKGII
ncbi:hypothetical protein ACFX15_017919 [Malus domestica]